MAARLEEIAEPGSIAVSGMVHESVRNRVDVTFVDLGEQSFKNIANPVRAYRIAVSPNASVADAPTGSDAVFRRPAVAVLPFDNLSDDPEQAYFADGLTPSASRRAQRPVYTKMASPADTVTPASRSQASMSST